MNRIEPPWAPGLRYLNSDEAPVALRFKERLEDFVVEELPAFEPSGRGEHLFLRIEKRGLSTTDLVRHLARVLEVPVRDIGWAGRKDARGLTRQWVSVPVEVQERLALVENESVCVLERALNERKLRLGSLAGNRFEIRLRGISAQDQARVERCLEVLQRRGLPNYFGAQRFGLHGHGYELGRALLERNWHGYFVQLTSPRHAPETPAMEELHAVVVGARRPDLRRLRFLAPELPREFAPLARQISRRPGDWESALRAVERGTLRFHLSALQSRLFNRVLASRIETFDRPGPGDLVQLHPTRSFFPVTAGEDLRELARRAEAGQISPTGPLVGASVPLAQGRAGDLEREALAAEGVSPETFAGLLRGLEMPGERRSLRAPIGNLGRSWVGRDLLLDFSLGRGSYATVLIAELSKTP